MSVRKVFTDVESGKELSYWISSSGNLLTLEICMADDTIAGITLDNKDSLEFISELNRLRRKLITEK